ncbi:MAG: hypothetical protein WKG07_32190 [Hymenobacter sp.]
MRGDVHFFALDSDPAEPDGISATSRQAQWLRQALAASQASLEGGVSAPRALFVGQARRHSHHAVALPRVGASVVLAGHDHHYERLVVDGLPYLVNGLGGRSISVGTRPLLAESQHFYSGDYGALLLAATPDSLTMQFFTRRQKLVDTYVLRQPVGPTPCCTR